MPARPASHTSTLPKPPKPSGPSGPSGLRGPNPISARISKPATLPLKPEFDDADLEADIEATPMPSPSALLESGTKITTAVATPPAPPLPAAAPASTPVAPPKAAPKSAAELDDDDDDLDDEELDAELDAARVKKKKIVIGLVALIAVLACGVAAIWVKQRSSNNPTDTARLLLEERSGAGAQAKAPGTRVIGPLVPEFLKPRLRSTQNLLLASAGAVASGGQNPQVLNDGNSENFDGSNGYATTNNNDPKEHMLITLKEARELSRIRFLLWDKDERSFRYVVSVSPDGKIWKKVQDNTKRESKSWQEIRFARQKVKAVMVKGVASSLNEFFHVVEIEGFDDGAVSENLTKRTPPRGAMKTSQSSLKPGVWAEYFDGLDAFPAVEDKPDLTRPQDAIAFGCSTPAASGQGMHDWPFLGACAAVYSGFVKIEKQNLYTFFVESENGARLYVDGDLLINNEGDHKFQELWEQVDLNPGYHRIYVEYYSFGAATGLNVALKGKGESKEFLSGKSLYYDPLETTGIDPELRRSPDTPRTSNKPYVKFLGRNDKRLGNWRNAVGRDGYVIFNKNGGGQHLQKLPPYIGTLTTAAEHCVWNLGEDPRELEDPEGKGQRIAGCEYSGNEALIDIRATRNIVHRLSIYFLDYDKLSRKDHVQFVSGDDVLYETDVENFGGGAWLEFEAAGSVLIKLQNACSTNAVVSGVFWDSERGVKLKVPAKGQPTVTTMKPGLVAEYYDGLPTYPTEDDVPTAARLVNTPSFGATPPPVGDRMLHNWPLGGVCGADFTGIVKVPADDKYTFCLSSDDGSRLYIDGEKVADNDGSHGMKEVEANVELKAGMHHIFLEYYNSGGPMGLELLLKQKDGKKTPIPAEWLGHE